jgi:heterodisulfide reductase subunit D
MVNPLPYEENLVRCMRCPDMCLCACPVFSVMKNQRVAPSHLAHVSYLFHKQDLPGNPEVIDTLYQCIQCGLCKTWCMYDDIDLPSLLTQTRTFAAEHCDESLFPDFVQRIKQNFEKNHSPYDTHGAARSPELTQKKSDTGDVLFFAGCTVRQFQPEIGVAALDILKKLGVSTMFQPGVEPCCGGPLLDLGFEKMGREYQRKVIDYVEGSGCQRVVSTCPQCVLALRKAQRELGNTPDLPIMHMATYLTGMIDTMKFSSTESHPQTITLDDDPVLARLLGIMEEPREIIKKIPGISMSEMETNHQHANPSSSYLGLPNPDFARTITLNRMHEAQRSRASMIVTCSPYAKRDLSSLEVKTIRIVDLVELIQERMRG